MYGANFQFPNFSSEGECFNIFQAVGIGLRHRARYREVSGVLNNHISDPVGFTAPRASRRFAKTITILAKLATNTIFTNFFSSHSKAILF
ncbi:hypothetical protein ASG50_18285 [Rhizobium sp. Leaf386]|nr:hypothetical protein ASG50_18285 [Rhizobium sp. Leaf386]